jgi:hypothetical protein
VLNSNFARCGSLGYVQNDFAEAACALLVVTGGAVLAGGYIQSAGAQCAPDAKIYIDPRLVPQRPHMKKQQFDRATLGADAETQKFLRDQYYSQNQPIQVPFRDGTVLISPSDPCIQQYIGR